MTDVVVEKTIAWGTEECVLRTFRVEGAAAQLAGFQSDPSLFVVNVVACDVGAAVEKLRAGGIVKTITSVHVFNQPMFRYEPLLDDSKGPYELIDVTPTLADCNTFCDFLVDDDLTTDAGVVCRAMMHFHHVVSGGMVMAANPIQMFSHTISGGVTVAGAIENSAEFYFEHSTTGVMLVGGETGSTSSGYLYTAGGGMTIAANGTANSSARTHLVSGTMTMTVKTRLSYHATASGTMGLNGQGSGIWGATYAGSGRLNINSGVGVESVNYSHVVTGVMSFAGEPLALVSNLGTIEMTAGVASGAFETGVTFSTIPVAPVVPTLTTVEVPCCSTPVLSVLNLSTNLLKLNALNRFLLRNNFSLPATTPMYYRPRYGVWQSNLHFSGLSAETSGNETWTFSFEFGCAEDRNGAWRFTMMINVKNSMQDYAVRLVVFFAQNVVCRASASFDRFEFGFNFKTLAATPVAIERSIFYDEIGIFAMSPSFNESPVLLFTMVANSVARTQTFDHLLEEQLLATEKTVV